MENSELKLILENCFTPAQLKSLLMLKQVQPNLYETAATSILNGDSGGDVVAQALDELSARQRNKIRSMTISQIRESLAPEFMESGKTLGSVLWALLRDDRIGARNLARTVFEQNSSGEGNTEINLDDENFVIMDSDHDEMNSDEANEVEMIDEDDIDVDSLLEELSRESQKDQVEHTDEDIEEVMLEEPDFSDLDSLLDADDDDDELPLEIPHESVINYDQIKADPLQIDDEDEFDRMDFDDNEIDGMDLDEDGNSIFGHPVTEEDFKQVEELLDLKHDESGEPYLEFADEEEMEYESEETEMVSLGGVFIALSSLKRACERVFEETVELVVDENLTSDDKIVVVGKNCGVKVLYGPHYSIHQPELPKRDEGDPVHVSPVSMQAALSRIYQEHVELIPDPSLMDQGVIPFAGKLTGIEVLQNDKIKVSLPPWVDSELSMQIQGGDTAPSAELVDKINDLEMRLAQLEENGITAAPPVPAAEPIIEPEPMPEPEPVEAEGDVAEEALSLDEIETEELEPIHHDMMEQDDDEEDEDGPIDELVLSEEDQDDLDDDDLDSLISGDELDEIAGELDDVVSEDDIDLGELDLDSMSDEIGELGELNLDEELDDDIEIDEDDDIGSTEINLDDEDLNLDDTDLDLDTEEINLDDLDLDLEGLDLDDEDTFEPREVFNGETVLLLGGDAKYKEDYSRIISELGGNGEWFEKLDDMAEDDINELVEKADVILTLTADAVSDPGILQATSTAQENNKRLFTHHSATPSSVQKQLVKLVDEGKV